MTETVASTAITPQQTEWTTEGSAAAPPEASPPVVDPRPTAAPIAVDNTSLETLLKSHPAPASDRWVMALEPNRFEDATVGPDAQISQTAYVEMTKPGGGTFLSPLSNVAYYRRKGFTEGAEQDIPDLVAYWAERARGTVSEEIVAGQTQEPDEPPDEVLLRYAGVPKTAEQLEAEREEVEAAREGRFDETRQPAAGTNQNQAVPPQPAPLPGPTPPEPESQPESEPESEPTL